MAGKDFHDLPGPLEEERRGRIPQERKSPAPDVFPPHRNSKRARQDSSKSNSQRAWKGTLADRARTARGTPQAVLKILSHGTGLKEAKRLARYIGQKGEKQVETDDGAILDTVEELDQLAEEWSADFSDRKSDARKTRDVMHLMVSVPVGSDPAKATDAARTFFADVFGENYQYAFAAHDETDHFHVHLLVKLRGRDGKQMRSSRKDPDLWRQRFAVRAREYGLKVDASPRSTRGKGRRSSPPTPIYEMRKRGVVPRTDEAAAKDALRRSLDPNDGPTVYEAAMRKVNRAERLDYANQAFEVIQRSKKLTDENERLNAFHMAADLSVWAAKMPNPRSRDETLINAIKPGKIGTEKLPDDVRALVKSTERAMRDQVKSFSRQAQRQAIAARVRLTNALDIGNKSTQQDRDLER